MNSIKHPCIKPCPHWRTVMWLIATIRVSLLVNAVTDTHFLGINNETGFNTEPSFVARSVAETKALGFGSVRMGIDNVGGATKGSAFVWASRDRAIDAYVTNGIAIHAVVSFRNHVSSGGGNWNQWTNNWAYFVQTVLTRYKDKVRYYIVDNEPDLSTVTAAQSVEFTKLAFHIARSIDANILIESPPTSRPDHSYLKAMIDLGIADYCDFLGVHVYGSQINDGRMNMPWRWMTARGLRKPVSASECGVSPAWAPAGVDGQEWRRRWLTQFYVAAKRWGYSHAMLFSLTFNESEWAYIDSRRNWVAIEPGYSELKNGFLRQPFGNGGFEEDSDWEHGWHIYFNPDSAKRPGAVEIVSNDPAGARSGAGYLRMATGTTTQPIIIRQLAEGLKPGIPYYAGVWNWTEGGGISRMKVLGWDHENGEGEISSTTSVKSHWAFLSTVFVPTKTWAVIELSAVGTGVSGNFAKWDDAIVIEKLDGFQVYSGPSLEELHEQNVELDVNPVSREITVDIKPGAEFFRLMHPLLDFEGDTIQITRSFLRQGQFVFTYEVSAKESTEHMPANKP